MRSDTWDALQRPASWRHSRGSTVKALAAGLALLGLLTACGDDRTAKSYCSYFYGQGQVFRQRYQDVNKRGQPLEEISALLGAQGDLAAFFNGLAKHSPDEIQADVEALASASQKQQDALGSAASNPVGAALNGVLSGLALAGPSSRVDAYTMRNCGPPPS